MNEFVAILDFGGQYKQLIARRVRECNVYCEILPYTTSLEALTARNPKGIILTGGPNSVYDPESPTYDRKLFELGIPVLGICYGSQLMAYKLGGDVKTAPTSEYGHTNVMIDARDSRIFARVLMGWPALSSIQIILQPCPRDSISLRTLQIVLSPLWKIPIRNSMRPSSIRKSPTPKRAPK